MDVKIKNLVPGMEQQDDTTKVFLNASGTRGEISSELKCFLRFLVEKRANSKFTGKLDVTVKQARKHDEEFKKEMELKQQNLYE